MSSYIVITTIFSPTEAIIAFAANENYKLVVAGDKKSPENWSCNNATFIPVSEQTTGEFQIAEVLPYNHYCRKMIGYLYAIKNGAEIIIDTDDDNIPKENWTFPALQAAYNYIPGNLGFINIYSLYSDKKIWPRGLPLQYLERRNDNLDHSLIKKTHVNVGIWQGLADEDPDVDAVYRLTDNSPCYFKESGEYVLGKGTISPFNSQNTMIIKELFPLLYLPTYVTFRFTDILRGLVAQPIMWAHDYLLGFCNATVVQKRNPHDYLKDFESEIPMYLYADKIINLIEGKILSSDSIEANLYNAYIILLNHKIVDSKEIVTLEAWLKDLKSLQH